MRCHLPICFLRLAERSNDRRSVISVSAESASGSFSSSKAAMSQAKHLRSSVSAHTIILAIRGWQGRAAMRLPNGVMSPSASMAPSDVSNSLALNTLARGGGVSQGRASTSFSPNMAMSSNIGVRSAYSISAVLCSAIRCSDALVQSR